MRKKYTKRKIYLRLKQFIFKIQVKCLELRSYLNLECCGRQFKWLIESLFWLLFERNRNGADCFFRWCSKSQVPMVPNCKMVRVQDKGVCHIITWIDAACVLLSFFLTYALILFINCFFYHACVILQFCLDCWVVNQI